MPHPATWGPVSCILLIRTAPPLASNLRGARDTNGSGLFVAIAGWSETLPDGIGNRALFEACLGGAFPIIASDDRFIALHVWQIAGEPSDMHATWIDLDGVRQRDVT
ncbi:MULTISPECIES: hypothetical protein [unclassified Bradyrhizobium]|uniref:hypothetical protein n=1 Tax=unclassified Bradyrhizobium TaxID=2631580 RepID=UPI002916121A|nr:MULTISPECIES: hypothetical protein [unclassified Bradyrhizobium]